MKIQRLTCAMVAMATVVAISSGGRVWALDPGEADPTFGPAGTGWVEYGIDGHYFEASDVAVDSQGRIVVAGFGEVDLGGGNWETEAMVLRYLPSGVLDTSFDFDGVREFGIPPYGLAPDPGRLLIGASDEIVFGYTRAYCAGICPPDNEEADFALYLLSPSGGITSSLRIPFNLGGGDRVNDYLADLAFMPDGRIAVVGTIERGGEFDTDFGIAMVERLQPNDTLALDTTFSDDGKATCFFDLGPSGAWMDEGTAVAIAGDGSILVGGTVFVGDGVGLDGTDMAICRFSTTGTNAGSWHSAGTFLDSRETLNDLAVLSNGKVLAGGTLPGSGGTDYALLRLSSALAPDTTFGTNGTGWAWVGFNYIFVGDTQDTLREMVVEPDGGIIVAGDIAGGALSSAVGVARFTGAGVLDTSYGIGGAGKSVFSFHTALNDNCHGFARQADGKTLAAGWTADGGNTKMFVVRLTAATGGSGNDFPFSDGFESGNFSAWSAVAP